jgi:glycosyltransferase involved in cell wall biosynthesis
MPGWNDYAAKMQNEIVKHADLVLCVMPSMMETLPGVDPARVRIMPNAVRLDSFERGRSQPCPQDLAAIPHPRIGFIGSVSRAVDFDAILHVAKARPDWHLVFVGWLDLTTGAADVRDRERVEKWNAILALPNVHHFQKIPAEAVPAYSANMDVNAVWYLNTSDGLWRHSQPIKLFENLAAGRPIVGPELPGFRAYDSVVGIADKAEGWLKTLTQAVEQGGVGTVEARIAIARENSWARRAEMLEGWMFEMMARQGSGARASAA